jgi:alpha-maltose-1-phosphate synthase
MKANKDRASHGTTILWVNFTRIDTDLFSMSLINIISKIAGLGHDVSLVALRTKTFSPPKNPHVHLITIPLKGSPSILPLIFTVFLWFYLPFITAISKIDVIIIDPYVHILSIFPQLFISKLKRTKMILDVRTIPVELKGFRGYLRNFWFEVSILVAKNFFDGMTIITPLMRKEICERSKIDTAEVGTWPSGVDTNLFDPEKNKLSAVKLKSELGLSKNFVVFYHGVLSDTRGLIETVGAVKLLKCTYPDIALFLLGSGPIASKLKKLVNDEGLQGSVFIHDAIDQVEVPKYIEMSDVCIVPLPDHPYWRAQSPLKLMEYLSMAKVVILSDIPAHKLIVGDKKCGVYLSSISPAEISQAVEYAYVNRSKLIEFGKIGRGIVEANYTWEKVAEDLDNYLTLVNNKKRGKLG